MRRKFYCVSAFLIAFFFCGNALAQTTVGTGEPRSLRDAKISSEQVWRTERRGPEEIERRIKNLERVVETIEKSYLKAEEKARLINAANEEISDLYNKLKDENFAKETTKVLNSSYRPYAIVLSAGHFRSVFSRAYLANYELENVFRKLAIRFGSSREKISPDFAAAFADLEEELAEIKKDIEKAESLASNLPAPVDEKTFLEARNRLREAYAKLREIHSGLLRAREDTAAILRMMK